METPMKRALVVVVTATLLALVMGEAIEPHSKYSPHKTKRASKHAEASALAESIEISSPLTVSDEEAKVMEQVRTSTLRPPKSQKHAHSAQDDNAQNENDESSDSDHGAHDAAGDDAPDQVKKKTEQGKITEGPIEDEATKGSRDGDHDEPANGPIDSSESVEPPRAKESKPKSGKRRFSTGKI